MKSRTRASCRWSVFVTRKLPGPALERLARAAQVEVWPQPSPPPRRILIDRLSRVDAILTMLTDRIDEDALARAAGLRVISNYAVGVDNIDLKAATRRGIAVGHTPGVLTEATADLAFGLMIAAARRIVEGDRAVRRGGWKTWSPDFPQSRQIS